MLQMTSLCKWRWTWVFFWSRKQKFRVRYLRIASVQIRCIIISFFCFFFFSLCANIFLLFFSLSLSSDSVEFCQRKYHTTIYQKRQSRSKSWSCFLYKRFLPTVHEMLMKLFTRTALCVWGFKKEWAVLVPQSCVTDINPRSLIFHTVKPRPCSSNHWYCLLTD